MTSILPDITEEQKKQLKKPDWYQPGAPPLTKEEVKEALKDAKVLKYPAITRGSVTDPIPGQSVGLISFAFFDNDEVRKGMHGLFRLDSVWPADEQANKRAEKVIEEMDSRHTIHHAKLGLWYPITNNTAFSAEVVDPDERKRAAEEHEKMKDDVFFQEREKAAKEARINERRKAELESGEYDKKETGDVHVYVVKKNLTKSLEDSIVRGQKKIEELREKLATTQTIIKDIEESHPEVLEEKDGVKLWLRIYNDECEKVGLPAKTEKEFWGEFHEKYM